MEAVAAPLWSSRRIREGVAYLGLAGLVASSALVFMGAEGRLGVLVPAARLRYPDWLRGPLSGLQIDLTPSGLALLLVGMCAGYVLVLVCADAVSMRVAIGTIVGLHVLFILGPPLVSTDVFGYIDLARLGTRHGISPYSPASTHIPPGSVHLYRRWHSALPAPYGPVFMLIAYALVPLGVAGGLWAFKILAAAGSLATIWLVWRCAAALGRDPLKAALFVGLNPALLLFGVGGAHNDFLVLTVATAAVYLLIAGRDRPRGGGGSGGHRDPDAAPRLARRGLDHSRRVDDVRPARGERLAPAVVRGLAASARRDLRGQPPAGGGARAHGLHRHHARDAVGWAAALGV